MDNMDNQSQMDYQQINQQTHTESPRSIYGNNIVICHSECMLGPHYYVFIPTFIAVSALLIVLYINVREIIAPVWNVVMLVSIATLMVSYLLIGFSNPGIVINKRKDEVTHQQNDQKYCQQCGIIRPLHSRHCKDCNCCIEGYDHHCPWIGKCVGESNKGRFFFFLSMMFGTLILFFIATISSAAAQK